MDFLVTALLQGLGFASLGLGIYISLRIFNIPDITTDGSYTLGGIITATLLVAGVNPLLTLVAAIGGGMIAGALTGIIHTRLKINPLLAGILVMTGLYSVNLFIMGRSNLPLINSKNIFNMLPNLNSTLSLWLVMLLFAIVLLMNIVWLLKTDFGIAMRATGNSEAMVRSMGVNTNRMKIIGLALANGLTSISGYLITQYQGFADINMGIGIVISGLGSVMIGEALLKPLINRGIIYHIVAVIIGSVLFRLILALALAFGLNPNFLKLVTALIVLIIVGISNTRKTAAQ